MPSLLSVPSGRVLVSSYTDDDVRKLLEDASIDDLYRDLSASLPGHEGFGTSAVAKGKAAYKNLLTRLRRDLCPHLRDPKIRRLIDSQNSSDAISLIAVLASLIASLGVLLNSTLVAVLVVRLGVRSLCPNL